MTSSQTLTHLPQRMHFESSLTIAGLDWSRRGFIFSPDPPFPDIQFFRKPLQFTVKVPVTIEAIVGMI